MVPRALVIAVLLLACDDPRVEARALARDDLACAGDADCCVVFDGCRAQGLIVSAADRQRAAELLAEAPRDACVKCVLPAVQVRCDAQRCTGFEVVQGPPVAGDAPVVSFSEDHCGSLPVPPGWQETGLTGSALRQGLTVGCE